MITPKVAKCHVRRVVESDYSRLESMYLAHEGESLPEGYFHEFQETIRDPLVDYFVAEVDGRIVGGGGISEYTPKFRACLSFGIVAPEECRKGYGTALIFTRLLYLDPGSDGCQILLQATQWSADFFARLGFKWYGQDEDEAGNRFLFGIHQMAPSDQKVFKKILTSGGVTYDFKADMDGELCNPKP